MAIGLLWKRSGLGSQEALAELKKELALPGRSREGIGHTGILDPFAEGWLLVGITEATKLLNPLNGLDKTYEAQVYIGASTETLDSTSELECPEGLLKDSVTEWMQRPLAEIELELKEFLASKEHSEFDQVPPRFSAVKIQGQRSYDLARKGVDFTPKSKRVRVMELEHLGLEKDKETQGLLWSIRLRVASGTYVRSLARDWVQELCHFPGHLRALRRIAVGPLGLNLPQEGWHPLQAEELKKFFDFHYLTEDEAERLQTHGRWKPKPHSRPVLLVGPGERGIVAWAQAGQGALGRVFKANPLL